MATGSELGSEEVFDKCCSACLEDKRYNQAEKYCVDCGLYYCGQCLRTHDRIPSSRGHLVTDTSASDTGTGHVALPTEHCKRHRGKVIDMYCADHDTVCCGTCIALDHRACAKVEYLPEVSAGVKDAKEYMEAKKTFHKVLETLKEAKIAKQEELSALEGDNEDLLQEIDSKGEELRERIRVLTNNTKDKLNEKYMETKTNAQKSLDEIEKAIARISVNEESLSKGNEAQIFVNIKLGKDAVKEAQTVLSEMSRYLKRRVLKFVPNKRLLDKVDNIGSINDKEEGTGEDEGYLAELLETFEVPDSDEVSAACCLKDSTLLVFDRTNAMLKRVNMEDLTIIDEIDLDGVSFSICPVGTREAAVAMEDEIKFVSLKRRMKVTRTFEAQHKCRGVAYNESSKELFVHNGHGLVKVYNKKGQVLRNLNSGSIPFKSIRSMVLDESTSKMYVADRKRGVLALTLTGDVLWEFNDQELRGAIDVCVLLPGDVVLVCGWHSGNVLQVDEHGRKLGVLITDEKGLVSPCALAVDKKRSRLIVGQRSSAMHVYTLTKPED